MELFIALLLPLFLLVWFRKSLPWLMFLPFYLVFGIGLMFVRGHQWFFHPLSLDAFESTAQPFLLYGMCLLLAWRESRGLLKKVTLPWWGTHATALFVFFVVWPFAWHLVDVHWLTGNSLLVYFYGFFLAWGVARLVEPMRRVDANDFVGGQDENWSLSYRSPRMQLSYDPTTGAVTVQAKKVNVSSPDGAKNAHRHFDGAVTLLNVSAASLPVLEQGSPSRFSCAVEHGVRRYQVVLSADFDGLGRRDLSFDTHTAEALAIQAVSQRIVEHVARQRADLWQALMQQEKAERAERLEQQDAHFKQAALAARDQLLTQAGIDPSKPHFLTWEQSGGVVTSLLAADHDGRGCIVSGAGKDVWVGHWQHAEAVFGTDRDIQVRVDDDAFRAKHLMERRFALLGYRPVELQQAWIDRITILSKASVA